jgi:hypothetical protein
MGDNSEYTKSHRIVALEGWGLWCVNYISIKKEKVHEEDEWWWLDLRQASY